MTHIDLPSDREVDQAIPRREASAHRTHVLSRVVIPIVLVVVGVVLLIVGAQMLAVLAFLAAAISAIADRLIRLGITSQGDRDREEARRREMQRTGRWKG